MTASAADFHIRALEGPLWRPSCNSSLHEWNRSPCTRFIWNSGKPMMPWIKDAAYKSWQGMVLDQIRFAFRRDSETMQRFYVTQVVIMVYLFRLIVESHRGGLFPASCSILFWLCCKGVAPASAGCRHCLQWGGRFGAWSMYPILHWWHVGCCKMPWVAAVKFQHPHHPFLNGSASGLMPKQQKSWRVCRGRYMLPKQMQSMQANRWDLEHQWESVNVMIARSVVPALWLNPYEAIWRPSTTYSDCLFLTGTSLLRTHQRSTVHTKPLTTLMYFCSVSHCVAGRRAPGLIYAASFLCYIPRILFAFWLRASNPYHSASIVNCRCRLRASMEATTPQSFVSVDGREHGNMQPPCIPRRPSDVCLQRTGKN